MDMERFWRELGKYDPSPADTQYALAVFAYECNELDSKQLISYELFKN